VGWLQNPIHALLIGLLILVTALHAALGLRSILTDYVSNRSLRSGGLILIRFTLVFSAIVGLGSLWVLIKSPP
jgi:succinate dehydrogenase hydrophobic membrane anchor protein